jgi:CRISPR/Cas system-associated exonuclease Cas4 (RecB family)
MESLSKCGIAYEKRYILGQRTPQSAAAARGTAVHRAIGADLQHKIDSHGALLPLDVVMDIARDAVGREFKADMGVEITEDDREEGLTNGHIVDSSVRLAKLHHEVVAPHLSPIRVARRWVLDIAGLDLQLAGEMDIETVGDYIRDSKTRSKSPNAAEAHDSLQLSTYALAKRQLDGVMPKAVVLDILVETPKQQRVYHKELVSIRTEEHLQPVLARLEHMDKIIKSGIFTPAPVGAWWCSARYCPYHSTCRYAARPVTVPSSRDPGLDSHRPQSGTCGEGSESNGVNKATGPAISSLTVGEDRNGEGAAASDVHSPSIVPPTSISMRMELPAMTSAAHNAADNGVVTRGAPVSSLPMPGKVRSEATAVADDAPELADTDLINRLTQSIEIAQGERKIHPVKER